MTALTRRAFLSGAAACALVPALPVPTLASTEPTAFRLTMGGKTLDFTAWGIDVLEPRAGDLAVSFRGIVGPVTWSE